MNALVASFSRTYRSWSTFKPSVLVFALPVLEPENMSWNAHTDHIHSQIGGKVKCLVILGKDGGVWGKTGDLGNITESDLKMYVISKKEVHEFYIKKETKEEEKFIFIRAEDEIAGFQKNGISVAGYVGGTHAGFAVAAEGHKIQDCFEVLTKLKTYMSGIGYS